MSMVTELAMDHPPATDGEIAIVNLESARRRSWARFFDDPHRSGVAELLVEQEWQEIQFVGDLDALDRLEMLVAQLNQSRVALDRQALIQAQVASIGHRFGEARGHLAVAERAGAATESIRHLAAALDQACGVRLDELLDARRRRAAASDTLQDLLPLGALLADLHEFAEADKIYHRALSVYADVSPFPLALVCFQLGVLWGEIVPDPQTCIAAQWYRVAIDYLPSYTKARVHLAEICNSSGRPDEAEALLLSMLEGSDPEIRWRLADVLLAKGDVATAEFHLRIARSRFEDLLGRHLLAFADHGAEFFAGSGGDPRRALELARANVANRPTLRAFELAHEIALSVGDTAAASDFLAEAERQWGGLAAMGRN